MKRVRTTARIATVLLGALLLASGACDFPQGANGNGQGGNGPGNGQTATLTVTVIGLGVVDVVGHGTAWSASTTSFQVNLNATISLHARPAGYFVGWTGNVADDESPQTTITMTGNQPVTATFLTAGVPISWSGWRGEYTVGDDVSTTTVDTWTCDALNKAGALEWSLTFHSEMHDDGDGYSTTGTITGSDSFTFPTRPPQGVRWLSDPTDFIFEGVVDYGIDGQDPFSAELVYYYTEWVYELVVVEDDGEVTAVSIESVDGYFNFCLFLVGAPAPFYCSGAQHVSSWNGGPSPLVPELHPECPL